MKNSTPPPIDELPKEVASDRSGGTGYPRNDPPAIQSSIVQQIVKFCCVGGVAFVVDFGLTYTFMKLVRVGGHLVSDSLGSFLLSNMSSLFGFAKGPSEAAAPILGGVASLIAMMANFLMNRAWTFGVRGKEERGKQMGRFYLVAITGQMISVGIFTVCYNAIGGKQLLISKMAGAFVAAFWNFTGSRYYAFKKRP